jgi:hypothetical protein
VCEYTECVIPVLFGGMFENILLFFYKTNKVKNVKNVKFGRLNSNARIHFIKHKNIHCGQEVVIYLFWRIKLQY